MLAYLNNLLAQIEGTLFNNPVSGFNLSMFI